MASLKVAFLDVGHGDFIYAETPFGQSLVIDVGTGDVVPSEFLKNVHVISEVQVSHPHTDHFDDIVGLSKKTIKSFRCPLLDNFNDQTIGWKKSDKAKIATLRGLKKSISHNDAMVSRGNGFNHTVWQPAGISYEDPNTASLVTTLSYGGTKILFGGDLPNSGWQSLLANPRFVQEISDTTIFKVPHHGRAEGCSDALFKHISPRVNIISDKALGKDNKNTVATSWYSARASGCNVRGYNEQRKVLSTRCDKSIFIEIQSTGEWSVFPDTKWQR